MKNNVSDKLNNLLPFHQGKLPNPKILSDLNVSDSTKKSYILNINNLRRLFNAYNLDFLLKMKPSLVAEKIFDIFIKDTYYCQKVLNVLNKYLTVIHFYEINQEYYNYYQNLLKRKNKRIKKIRMRNERIGKLNENWINYEQITELRDNLIKERDFQKALLLALYTRIPPVRNDYYNLKVKNYNPEIDNYYGNKILVLNNYKTAKYYGRIIIRIDNTLKELIKKNINDTDFLFITEKGVPFSSTNFTKYFQKIFQENFNTKTNFQMMRNIYITHMYEKKDLSLEKIKLINRIMGHSLEQSLLYRKFKEIK